MFHLRLIFASKAGATEVEPLMVLQSNGRLLALPRNTRLWLHVMAVSNTLAYYDAATITVVKNYTAQGRGSVQRF
jgi:hypothetical protein